jgi:chloramphenicol 3-O phosphotransferase
VTFGGPTPQIINLALADDDLVSSDVENPTQQEFTLALVFDGRRPLDQTGHVPAPLIVLNGPSSSGKTSIIKALQDLWPRPLFTSGIDAFIAGWPESHVTFPGEDGSPAADSGMRIVHGLGPAPSWIPEYGDEFHKVTQFAHELWRAMSVGGIDLIIDHVVVDAVIRGQARSTLVDAFWVGVTCDVNELIRREIARGDRYLGFASGTSAVAHEEMIYDLVVDTTSTATEVLANQIFDAVIGN